VIGRVEEEPPPQSRVGATVTPVAIPGDAPERTGPREGLVLGLFVLATLAASAFVLAGAERDALHDPKQKAARGEIQGLSELSLLREQNLRRALAKVAAGRFPLVSNIRVAADRVNVSVRDADGFRRYLTIDPGLGVTSSDVGVGEDYAIAATELDAGAPERMARAVAARTGYGPDAVDYAVLAPSKGSEQSWYMFLKQGPARVRQWTAAADGSDLRKPGEPAARDKAAGKP
jgi:hypothetical protein